MADHVIIPCPICDGKGAKTVYVAMLPGRWHQGMDPGLVEDVKCETCNGFKVLIATGVKAVTSARMVGIKDWLPTSDPSSIERLQT